MPKRLMVAMLLVAASILAGCGAVPKIDGDPAKLAGIRSIAVIRAPEPRTYTILVVSPTMIGFAAPRMGADYFPTITAAATLLGKDRKDRIYVGFHASGWEMKREGWTIRRRR